MGKSVAISIRVDDELKAKSEQVMAEFGLNMSTTVNMLLKQIVREQAIPLSLNANPYRSAWEDVLASQMQLMTGRQGTPANKVADELDALITEVENGG